MNLLKQGAKLVCNPNDILEEFGEHLISERVSGANLPGPQLPNGSFKPATKIERQMIFWVAV